MSNTPRSSNDLISSAAPSFTSLPDKPYISLENATTMMAHGPAALHDFFASKVEAALGRPLSQMEIRLRNVSLSADVAVADTNPEADKPELPTLFNTIKKAAMQLSIKKHVVHKSILKDFTGVFRPGTITLVLGQPCAGKSSLMKLLSARFHMSKNVQLQGEITYNGCPREELLKKLPQLVAYVTQRDHHFPTLTVRETLEFAHRCCRGNGEIPKVLADRLVNGTPDEIAQAMQTCRAWVKYSPEVVIQYLGLEQCQDTIVGNAMLRGISGGERKRVTTGEMAFGRSNAMFMDEISTGLDSAATFDIINTERSIAKRLHKTVVISLLQPPPEVYDLFDDVLLLNDGEVLYHGPREQVLAHFESLGFKCPPQRDPADFLLDLGSKMQTRYEVPFPTCSSFAIKYPRLPSEFADAFRRSELHAQTLRRLDEPVDPLLLEDLKLMRTRPTFFQSYMESNATLMARQMKVTFRNTPFLFGRSIMVVIMALFYSSVFYQFNPTNVQVVLGMLFASTMFISLGQAAQIPTFIDARGIFYKQRASNFYRTWSYVLSSSICRLPLSALESLVLGTMVYWMCGFVSRAQTYIVFMILLFLANTAFGAWFFLLASVAPSLYVAKPLSTVTVVVFILSSGFVISPHYMPGYFVWVYWLNPMAWAYRAMAINEYLSPELDVNVFDGVNYMEQFGKTMGQYFLDLWGVPSNKNWVWAGVVYLIGCFWFFMFLSYLSLEYIRYDQTSNFGIVKKDDESEATEPLQNYTIMQTPRNACTLPHVAAPAPLPSPAVSDDDQVVIAMPARAKNFVPVTLAFEDLWYTVPLPGNHRDSLDLLKGISGYAFPGTMTALMGSSGAGKTTLMDVIAGRKNTGKICGKILLNGHEATDLAIRRCTGYCEQMDIHSESATFREALTFSSFLRQGSEVPESVKYESVQECLELLGLEPIADNIIRGSSLEQMKRLTIGVELAAQPSVLFLDEPTSGLDARSAKLIMDGVRKVADTGRTVVCTIHQPSSEVFFLFDRLLLLKRGGEVVYFGDVGAKSSKLVHYFESIPGVDKCPEGYNPATWMLEVIGAGVGNTCADDKNFVEIFKESENRRLLMEKLNTDGVNRPCAGVFALTFNHKRAATNWTQLRFLLVRFLRMYWRTAPYNLTRFGITIFLGLLFGLVYLRVQYDTFSGLTSGIGMIFLVVSFLGAISLNASLPPISLERPSFYRERACQTYNALWYFVSTTVVEIPYVFASCLVFTAIVFFMVRFTGFVNFVCFWVDTSLLVLTVTYLGQLLVFATPSVEVAAIFGVLVNSVCALFLGFNPPPSAMPSGYGWFYVIIPQHYVFSFLVANVFGECSARDQLGCTIISDAPGEYANLTAMEFVGKMYHIHHDDMWTNFGVSILFIVIYRLLALLALRYLCFQKR